LYGPALLFAERTRLLVEVSPAAMNERAIRVTILALKPGLEELLIPELVPLIQAGRSIDGCLSFDLYRLSEERSTLVLHEIWETHREMRAYTIGPLKAEITSLVTRFLIEPLRTWEVEEVF
jgi:quinol monooxygenase YgiN